ncbi:uncharacterized protein LOC124667687 [Lolium rigidum]|uniref:uncharacterized protein LOC124667687 n=1 Tax=Lolium rigidum TaxID=89674 RepID=UPI001F5D5165|nr:uncharacterized protein LOC124667687 [Lolium rigidum]
MDSSMEDLGKQALERLGLLAELGELAQQAAILGNIDNLYTECYLHKDSYRQVPETGLQWIMRCFGRPRYFYNMFRMTPEVFTTLHDLLVSTYGLKSTNNVSSVESLAMFLWIVGGPQAFAQAENQFTRSLWTVHTKFKEVLYYLRKLARDNIKPRDPTFSIEHEKVKEDRFWPHFKDAIGAIDGSHVPCSVPAEDVVNHTCRHGYTSQNVLAICDFDMRFTFVVAGWPGSAHDTRILHHALANFSSFPVPPKGKYYLVDSGYPNRIGYLAPFKGSTYHLPEFRLRRGRALQGKYEIFNFFHSSLRNVIERAFGVLKKKWRILKAMPSFSTRTQKHIILACIALHNFIRDSKLRDQEFDKCDEDEDYLPGAARASPQTQGDDEPEVNNKESMNDVRSRIVDALLIAREE